MFDQEFIKKLIEEQILSQGTAGAQPFGTGSDVASQVQQALQSNGPSGNNTADIYGRSLRPVPERGIMSQGADPGSGQDGQGIANQMGSRMRGMPGAEGQEEMSIGQKIAMVLAAGIEGGAAGYTGRAPQSPQIIMQAMARRNQQGMDKRKMAREDEEFELRKQQFGAQQDKAEMDKLTGAFDLVKKLSDLGIDEAGATTLSAKLAEKMVGDPELAGPFKDMLSNSSMVDVVAQRFPDQVKQYGVRETIKMYKDPAFRSSMIEEQKAREDEGVREQIRTLQQQGKIIPGQTKLADIESQITGVGKKRLKPEDWETFGVVTPKMESDEKKQGRIDERQQRSLDMQMQRFEEQQRQFGMSQSAIQQRHNDSMAMMMQRFERPTTEQVTKLANFKEGEQVLGDLAKNHARAFAGDKPMSAALRASILKNNTARTLKEIAPLGGAVTDAERDFVASYNTALGSMYKLTDERQLSEIEGMRNLQSINPVGSVEQVQKNILSRAGSLSRQRDNWIGSMRDVGYNVPQTLQREQQGGAAQAGPKVGTVVKGYEYVGGDPAKKESWKKVGAK